MSVKNEELLQRLESAKKELEIFQKYAEQQANFKFPIANISIEPDNDRTNVYMDVEYNGTKFQLESMKPRHLDSISNCLDSQLIVREKYADGKVRNPNQTDARVKDLSNRFMNVDSGNDSKLLNLFSGFAVSDVETDTFLGMCVLGSSSLSPNTSEVAFINRPEAWSYISEETVKQYEYKRDANVKKKYQGVATTEVCTLLQYARTLQEKNYKINGNDFNGEVVMTARIDNPGSWKAGAKGGFVVYDVDSNPNYGPQLRYQMKTKI